ncbi:hypothetical protein [Bacteroides helcogenes]|uniref:Lipoprotein n=1 Tax=Bacteroides helcogenes (strain ATCC 35417 / DSM 20613 / JCM 6297 / CCUG 15421 / P 36-108) TaxID=693979 RepID=E6SVS5_BACT6|nr:hypothetical protein [Bacteroides helcogenes]ADV44514.1 putative lipoprotein [Bacteroides helcogenes P 36-108]MDY5239012.1 hypothetical protein [Bacteroides helcogenes]
MRLFTRIFLVMMLCIGLASCEESQESIESAIVGRSWTGDVGVNADNGEALFSTFTFGTDGFGTESQYYSSDGEFYKSYRFQWYWEDGYNTNLVLNYGAYDISYMENVSIGGGKLWGTFYLSNNAPGFNFTLRME